MTGPEPADEAFEGTALSSRLRTVVLQLQAARLKSETLLALVLEATKRSYYVRQEDE